jgi:hypothetical protein
MSNRPSEAKSASRLNEQRKDATATVPLGKQKLIN